MCLSVFDAIQRKVLRRHHSVFKAEVNAMRETAMFLRPKWLPRKKSDVFEAEAPKPESSRVLDMYQKLSIHVLYIHIYIYMLVWALTLMALYVFVVLTPEGVLVKTFCRCKLRLSLALRSVHRLLA